MSADAAAAFELLRARTRAAAETQRERAERAVIESERRAVRLRLAEATQSEDEGETLRHVLAAPLPDDVVKALERVVSRMTIRPPGLSVRNCSRRARSTRAVSVTSRQVTSTLPSGSSCPPDG